MSVAGFKKQFHKASQLFNEKINGAEGTKLDEEFLRMEQRVDVTHKLVLELVPKTTEYLQPNPAYRAKVGMINTVSRIRGQVKTGGYPQTESTLGDAMLRYGSELGVESSFGCALVDVGGALKQMAQGRDALDVQVKHGFIDPLQMLHDKDLREIGYHLRKLEGRRLDFDYKKRRKGKISDVEIKQAFDKFEESKELAERSMFNLLENDVEQVHHLSTMVEAALEYHRQSYQILTDLRSTLQSRIMTATRRPKRHFTRKPAMGTTCYTEPNGITFSSSFQSSEAEMSEIMSEKSTPAVSHPMEQFASLPCGLQSPTFNRERDSPLDQPCCRALYSFQPENTGELRFKEGDLIILTNQIDENWFEGMLSGESGFFPISYVQILVPLPQ